MTECEPYVVIESGIDMETSSPQVILHIHAHDDTDEILDLPAVEMSATEARVFAVNLLHIAVETEVNAGYVMGMRAMKIPEDTIDDVIKEASTVIMMRRAING